MFVYFFEMFAVNNICKLHNITFEHLFLRSKLHVMHISCSVQSKYIGVQGICVSFCFVLKMPKIKYRLDFNESFWGAKKESSRIVRVALHNTQDEEYSRIEKRHSFY